MMIFFIFAVVIAITVLLSHYFQVKRKKQLQKKGLTIILHLKKLVGLIQVHRGLTSAWLNGDDSKKYNLVSFEQEITVEIHYLQQQGSMMTNSRWESFIDHWGRLIQHDAKRDADDSFHQHTQLVVGLLYLLEDQAELHYLDALSLPNFPTVGLVWRELMTTIESIGQSRGIGAGVATCKNCSSVNKIRLSFLLVHIQQTMNETLAKLSSLDEVKANHTELLNIAQLKMKLLSTTIDKELIGSQEITIGQDTYFALATDCIKAVDNIFEHQVQQIEQVI